MKNLKVAQAILDAFGINEDGNALALLLTRAVRADSLGHGDRYKNACSDIEAYIKHSMKTAELGDDKPEGAE